LLRGEIGLLKEKLDGYDRKLQLTGGNIYGEYIIKGNEKDVEESGKNGLRFSDALMADLDFAFQPNSRLSGEFTLNILANVSDSDFEYGRFTNKGLPVTVQEIEESNTGTSRSNYTIEDQERIEIYDFEATYEGDSFFLEAFYHKPRFHWPDKGDFFGLLREATDMKEMDIWNAKAPYGIEYRGKDNGLTVVAGPEVYWGANPKVIVKYDFDLAGLDYTLIHAEDIAEREDLSGQSTDVPKDQSRQTALYTRLNLSESFALELGGLVSGSEKVGDTYDRVEGDNNDIFIDEIDDEDTLGFRAKLSSTAGGVQSYIGYNYAGLVADAGDEYRTNGTQLPFTSGGNKEEVEGGVLIPLGDFTIYPRFLIRENLVEANPLIAAGGSDTTLFPGVSPRNLDDDPFAVLGNRGVESFELMLTYDPTPATYFYDWNADLLEDAPFAFNIGLTVYDWEATDAFQYINEFDEVATFGEGLDAEETYHLRSKFIFNPSPSLKYIVRIERGETQPAGDPTVEDLIDYSAISAKVVVNKQHIFEGYYKEDTWPSYDYFRTFGLTYPSQYKLEYTYLFDPRLGEDKSSQVGVRALYRSLDENSDPDDGFDEGENGHMYEVVTYFQYFF